MAKRFFYVCAGIFLLALSYHFGALSAVAQQGTQVTGFAAQSGYYFSVLTPNGDVYARTMPTGGAPGALEYHGNFWSGPTAAQPTTFGAVKAKYHN